MAQNVQTKTKEEERHLFGDVNNYAQLPVDTNKPQSSPSLTNLPLTP